MLSFRFDLVAAWFRANWLAPAVGLLGAAMLLLRLGEGSLEPWDEAVYAQSAKEMVQGGDWLTPHYNFAPRLEKPPLLTWSIAILYKLFGVSEFWARMASVIPAVGLIVLVYLIGKRLSDWLVGLLGVAVLLTSFQFVNNARWCTTDVMLSFFLLLSLYGYLRTRTGTANWWYVVGGAWGLAFLTKGTAMVVAPVVIAVDLAIERRLAATLRARQFWGALLLAFAIAAPWVICMWVLHRDLLLERVYFNTVVRTTHPIEGHAGSAGFYLQALNGFFFPWCYLLPFTLAAGLYDCRRGRAVSRVLLILAAVVFGLYTVIQTKLEWYIMPLYPALAILTGSLLAGALRSSRSLSFVGLVLGTCIVARTTPQELVPLAVAGLLWIVFVLARKTLAHQTLVILLVALLTISGFDTLRPLYHKEAYHEEVDSAARLARLSATAGLADRDPLLLFNAFYLRHPTVRFYSNRPLQLVETLEELVGSLANEQPRELLLPISEIPALSELCQVDVLAEDGPFAYAVVRCGTSPAVQTAAAPDAVPLAAEKAIWFSRQPPNGTRGLRFGETRSTL